MNQQERISAAIAEMNAERERAAAYATKQHIAEIIDLTAKIAALTKQRDEAKAKLQAVSYEPVNAKDILA